MLQFTVFSYNCAIAFFKWTRQKYCYSDRYFRVFPAFLQLLYISLKVATNLSSLPQKVWGFVCKGPNRKSKANQWGNQIKGVERLLREHTKPTVTAWSAWRSISSELLKAHSCPLCCSHLLSVALAGSTQVFKPEHCIHSVSSLKFIWIS